MRQHSQKDTVGSPTMPPVYAVEIPRFVHLLQENYANLISYPQQTISTATWNWNRNRESLVFCKIQKMQGDRRCQSSRWTPVSRQSTGSVRGTQVRDFIRHVFMVMGKTAGKMLHVPVKNSRNTETKDGLESSCDIYGGSEALKAKSSSRNERTTLPEYQPKSFPCKPRKPPHWYKHVLKTHWELSTSPVVANHSPELSQVTNFSLPALRLCISPTQSNRVVDTQSTGNNKLEGKIAKRVFRYLPLRGKKACMQFLNGELYPRTH